jgi:hypothetical protein
MRRGRRFDLLGLLFLFHLLYLSALVFDLLLLLLQLALRLLSLDLLVLHFIANHVSAGCAQSATNCGARARMTDRGTDYCASASAQESADAGTFFALAERLPRTSRNQKGRRECQCSRG